MSYTDIANSPYLTQEDKIRAINELGEAERFAIDEENKQAKNRILRGSALQVASGLPILNVPYVGTGLGGAMYEAGNSIMQGKPQNEILKDFARGFAIGESVGAIPYIGKFAGKTKTGQAIGEKASNLFNNLKNTDIGRKLGEKASNVYDYLITDVKAFNPNKQISYHGSPFDFNKFSNEAIGTGEEAQAHGLGHYTALNKDIADKRYRKRLSLYKSEIDVPDNLPDNVKSSLINKIKEKNNGQLYKVAIPKDDVLLRENLPFNEQSPKVQKALKEIQQERLKQAGFKSQKEVNKMLDNLNNEYENAVKTPLSPWETSPIPNIQSKISNLEQLQPFWEKGYRRNYIYDKLGTPQEATDLLNKHGIKGISYNGGIDGEARVIFNPDDIDIVRKYYNQPSLYEQISGIQPSTGAVSSNLYEYLKNPKANYNYEKELNIFNDYPPNIDPNTLRVTIGDVSNDSYNLGLNNGYNLENFKHTLDNSSYNHFLNGHYGINEKDERLLPLGENDIKYIPNIIYYPDSIEFLAPTKRKLPRIKYSKLANNGNYIYVEELQNNKKRLNTKTMWKEK